MFIKVVVTMPVEYKEAFQKEAEAGGRNLSEFVRDCCVANLGASHQKHLPEIVETRGRKPGD